MNAEGPIATRRFVGSIEGKSRLGIGLLLMASLHEQGVLRPGLSLEEATDIVWALTSYDLYRMLVVDRHWEPERYEMWLAQLLIQQLLASASG